MSHRGWQAPGVMQKPYRIGDRVCVRGQQVYPLPAGLRDGQEVIVIAFLPGRRIVEAAGRRFTVAMGNIHSGWLAWSPRVRVRGREPVR